MERFQSLIKNINSIILDECDGIYCGDLLYYILKGKTECSDFKDLLSAIKMILYTIWFDDVDIDCFGDGSSLFLFSNSYRGRVDHLNNFNSIVSLFQNRIYMKPGKKRIHYHTGYYRIICKWNGKLKGVILSRGLRLYIISCILKAYSDFDFFKQYIYERKFIVSSLVTFCDVHAIDSFFTQKFNQEGLNTVTLQHGVFTSVTNYWPFVGSRSKFFLASNQFSIDEARKLDYKNKMIVAGIYSYVGKEEIQMKKIKEIKVIGVFLDAEIYRDDNIKTINIIADYNRKYGKKIKIKFHPVSKIDSYDKFIERIPRVECIGKEKTVIDFCKEVDVIIVRNSTTLIEALQFGIPSYIIHNDDQTDDMYKNVDSLKFTSAEDLHELIDRQDLDQIKKQMRGGQEYFCVDGNITNNYKNIFHKLGIN